jgi:hypothetical protein
MKKILFALLLICISISCSKENIDYVQYIYKDDSILIIYHKSSEITIYNKGKYCYQNFTSYTTEGEYPNYHIYYHEFSDNSDNNELEMYISYINKDQFYARFVTNSTWKCTFLFPEIMLFKGDNRKVDKNGDGILDSYQNQP